MRPDGTTELNQQKKESHAATPNYDYERKERERLKAIKKAEKQAAKAAAKERGEPSGETDAETTKDSDQSSGRRCSGNDAEPSTDGNAGRAIGVCLLADPVAASIDRLRGFSSCKAKQPQMKANLFTAAIAVAATARRRAILMAKAEIAKLPFHERWLMPKPSTPTAFPTGTMSLPILRPPQSRKRGCRTSRLSIWSDA